MELRITGRHTALVDDKVKAYANEKLGPLSKYYDRTRLLEVVFDEGKQGWKVEAIAHVQNGAPIVATIAHKDALAAIDLAHDKLERLLTREKDKRRTRRRGADGRAAAAPAAAGGTSEEE